MRFFHISDLHIGKQLYYYPLKENQRAVFQEIITAVETYQPDGLLIAGDIYDKSAPSGEAYTIFDEFLTKLARCTPSPAVLMIAGNHDSAQRLAYASGFLAEHNIHIAAFPPLNAEEHIKKVVLKDQWGPVNVYLLPFTKPGYVKYLFPEEKAASYDEAVGALIMREALDVSERNVLVSHQFYVSGSQSPETCQSEQAYISVGGIDSVEAARVKDFDYVALGHLHGAQWIGQPNIRYCGTPLKYSVSEASQEKSITMVTLEEKGTPPVIETIPLTAVQDVRREKGRLEEILERARAMGPEERKNFVSITLTDEEEVFHPREQLEEYFPYLLEIQVENSRTRAVFSQEQEGPDRLDAMDAFRRFYQEIQGVSMNEEEERILTEVIQKVKEGEE